MKLLICDDEDDILMMLQRFLSAKGYDLLLARNGEEALKQAQHQPDLILLDIAMPPPDGLEVCRRIRRFLDCPILFLSARISENDKVKGFASGGDDYIIKPFSLIELEARIAAHLRRQHRALGRGRIKFAHDLSIDYQGHAVYYKEEKINFAKKEFEIIALLSQNAGQVFDKERIYEAVWGYDSDGDSSVVAEHIRRIRAKLGVIDNHTYIETIWGCGYKWLK